MDAPRQVIFIAIEPTTSAGQEKLAEGLRKLMAEDPTFRIDSDVRTSRMIVHGTDELQLEGIVERLRVSSTSRRPPAGHRSHTRKR
jgi:elongation factor G